MTLRAMLLGALAAWTLAGPAAAAAPDPFAAAGFRPLAELAAQKREVRRALFHDPFVTLSVPGVEFERLKDGRVAMTLVGPGLKAEPFLLPASAWTGLAAAEGRVFEGAAPLPDCPAWSLRLGSTGPRGARTAAVSGCVIDDAAEAYVAALTRLAVSTRADCVFDPDNPFWTFPDCFE